MAQEKLLLIDGSSLAFRAFYAMYTQMDRFTTKDGLHTNAIMTFNSMLDNVVDQFKPDHILVAFDKSGGTFRTKMFSDYKAQRDAAPSEFLEQLPYIHELLDDHGIKHYALQDYEADDVIGTLAKAADARG
ncbi:MAG: DNA polymerase I, partial [Lactobacillus sp.]|nr:DNA polymerase I [Lactobacillus sp.]